MQTNILAIRKWPNTDKDYTLTFHTGETNAHKIESYDSIEQIKEKYPNFLWIPPNKNDTADILQVGVYLPFRLPKTSSFRRG